MSIGIEVFHRNPATYDPNSDPIVRVNVSRLRERLVKHYAMFEAPPQVRIGATCPSLLSLVRGS